MPPTALEQLRAEVRATKAVRDVGRVTEVSRGTVQVSGISKVAALGDQVRWISVDWRSMLGEVIRLGPQGATILMAGPSDGIAIGDRVQHLGPSEISPDDHWVGRIIDPLGQPLDGRPLLRGMVPRALRAEPPPAARRRALGGRLETGMAAFNTLLPIVAGQRIGLFSGSGVGKSRLLAQLATGIEADVVVIALVGERGRECREHSELTGLCTI